MAEKAPVYKTSGNIGVLKRFNAGGSSDFMERFVNGSSDFIERFVNGLKKRKGLIRDSSTVGIGLLAVLSKESLPMAATAENLNAAAKRNSDGDCCAKRPEPEGEVRLWAPPDLESAPPKRESELAQKIQICTEKLNNSDFACRFFNKMRTPEFNRTLLKALGSERKIQMVIYGIGSIDSSDVSRIQLSLAILMKRKFDWIGDVEVFDPVISETESKVMESLGCSVLSVNEYGWREVAKPTLFFMPHCDEYLYDNLLEANWAVDRLTRVLVLGNSFTFYKNVSEQLGDCSIRDNMKMEHILSARRFAHEFQFSVGPLEDEYHRAFVFLSWHFFNPADDAELEVCRKV